MLERFLLLWLVASSAAAFWWPQLTPWLPGRGDPFVGTSKTMVAWLIACTMFAIGLMLPRDEVRQVIRRWPTVLGGTTLQYLSMPLLAYAVGSLWGLRGEYFAGLVLVGCVPGAMASNVLTLNAGGNTSYSVSLTTTATLLSPLAVPLLLGMALAASGSVTISFLDVSRKLVMTVVGPVVLGHLLGRQFPAWERHTRRWGSRVANLAILWIIAAVVGQNRARLGALQVDLLLALLVVNLGGYLAGYLGGRAMRLPEGMRRALTLEIGMQNAGLGTWLALELFSDAAVAIAPAMYTFGCMLTGTLLAQAWGRRSAECGTRNAEE